MVHILSGESHGSDEQWEEDKISRGSEWSQLVIEGHTVHHLIDRVSKITLGKIQIDGVIYTYNEARDKYFN